MDTNMRRRLRLLFDDLKVARLDGDIEKAQECLVEIRALLSDSSDSEEWKNLSREFYEIGMVLNDLGRFREAAEAFTQSGDVAAVHGDALRASIGSFRHTLTLYLGGEMDVIQAHRQFLAVEQDRRRMDEVPTPDTNLKRGADFNLAKRLAETAFDAVTDDFEGWREYILSHEFLSESRVEPDPSYELCRAQMLAMGHMWNGAFDEAVSVYAAYLETDMPLIEASASVFIPQEVRKLAHTSAGEIARDYRNAGRALRQSSVSDRDHAAKFAYARGLEFGNGRGNLRFVSDIRADLASMGD